MSWSDEKLVRVLKENGVVVMPTDTLYGVVGRAENEAVVKRIYEIRKRSPAKPCIILVGSLSELAKFGVILNEAEEKIFKKYEASPTSFILDCPLEKFSYLHRGTKTLAFRLPYPQALRDLLLETGPLIAPSANPESLLPSKTITEAKKYFSDSIDLYVDGGVLDGRASRVVRLFNDGSVSIIRQ